MKDDYWKAFWAEHARTTAYQDIQSQVLRTLNKAPISKAQFQKILKEIEGKMEICTNDEVLDLCCGNGVITKYLASKCKRVVGVDFVPELVAQIDLKKHPNICCIVEDARKVDFNKQSFDKIIIYAGLQYLSYKETIYLFDSVVRWLKSGGLFYIGDIPDRERRWNFFNTDERERAYFDSIKNEKPVVGTWFESEWLIKLGRYTSFKDVEILQQSKGLPYAHYRFGMVLKKS